MRSLEPADYFLFLAFPLIITEIGLGYQMVKWGAGVHQWQVTLGQLFEQLYWANAAQIVYCPLSFVVKMAILLQYLRLFAPSRKGHEFMWYGAWATIGATFMVYSFFTFWTMFYCRPRRFIWDKLTPGGKCYDVNDIILSQGAFNMVSDVIILLLPSWSLWKLDVPLVRKLWITLMFATGLVACIASAMRIWFTLKITDVISKADVSWYGLFIGIWTTLEVALVFVVACTLCIPKLIQSKGKKVKKVLSHAATPFSAIPSMVKRRAGTQTDTQRNSAMSGQTIVEQTSNWDNIDLDDKKPKYFEEREHTHWQEEIDSRTTKPSKTFSRTSNSSGSTGYSQRSGSRHSGQHNDGFQLQPLHTPEFSRQQGQWGKSAFSP
ncbi:hypothetical protein B5807_03940 [Epicoccum nigrum]|uniref:Rhodopsin domain-containing protein n=1 Tax=Epicoccum nigrum TaxID=105696 RepID=A0A1Y2M9F6_EPING|nr:hypothetical protein B5807_03940 [Epicoccum nigrum]